MFKIVRRYWPGGLALAPFLLVGVVAACVVGSATTLKGAAEDAIVAWVGTGAFTFAAFLATALLCIYRRRRRRPLSYTLVWPAALVASLVTTLLGFVWGAGGEALQASYWLNWPAVRWWLIFLPWGFAVSVPVALGVVALGKRDA